MLSFSWIRPIIKSLAGKYHRFVVVGGPGRAFLARVQRTGESPANRKNWNAPVRRQIYDNEGHAHFITFSCYRRRRLLDDSRAKGIVVHFLSAQLINQGGNCIGFVVMPDHVHALVRFDAPESLSVFMNQWKRRPSIQLKRLYSTALRHYGEKVDLNGPIWQPRYYSFNVFSKAKVMDKLDYMHSNPMKAGLAGAP
jgi:putative transposase